MTDNTKIEWAEATANYVNGCSVVSPGCTNCYAMRSGGRNLPNYPSTGLTKATKAGHVWTGEVRANVKVLDQVLRWKKPRAIFWNAHGDLFHENVPDEWIDRQFAVMALTPQHRHMVLTKRPKRMREYLVERNGMGCSQICRAINEIPNKLGDRHGALSMPLPNVWLGTSVEDQARADERIPHLLATPAAVRFISAEPLLGPVDLTRIEWGGDMIWGRTDALAGVKTCLEFPGEPRPAKGRINWVIVGGESGPGARFMSDDWAQALVDQCKAACVPVFVKQLSSGGPKAIKDIEAFPLGLRVREAPHAG